jgi:glycosyltransferase involved in cell wall biosynthesis
MKKVSFVCTTYGRFNCVERIVAQFHAQTYPNKELVIFNTDEEHAYELGFEDDSIVVVNNNINYQTACQYENRGQICRDAVTHATGDYFMLADDDDIYLPWHLQQAVDGIEENGKDAWKPEQSFFATQDSVMLVMNTLEASVIVKINRIKEIGFRSDITGYEGLSWYTRLRDERQLDEHNKNYIPSYCFNWSDTAEVAGHKQSGDINNPNNFENHKLASIDYAKRPLEKLSKEQIDLVYKKYYNWIEANLDKFNNEYYDRYAKMFTNN